MGKLGNFWKTVLAGGAGVAALAAVNASIRRGAHEPDDSALGGTSRVFPWKHGRIFYKEAGLTNPGLPIVFIHGVGAGFSSFMWRKNFDVLGNNFRVYALDLLGFGLSDKPAGAPYSSKLYVELLSDFIRDVVGQPANVVASSLGAAYAVQTAEEHPELVNAMILNAPAGYATLNTRPGMAGAAFYGLLQSPVLGTSFYNAVTSERGVRDYARGQLFYEKRFATPRLVAHYYAVSHLPGAQHAATAFLSGYLNTDIREPFARLRQPVTIAWGRQDAMNPIEQAGLLLRLNPRSRLEVFDRCRMMPQEEHAEHFNALLRTAFRDLA